MFYFPARRRPGCRISLTPDPQHSTTSCAGPLRTLGSFPGSSAISLPQAPSPSPHGSPSSPSNISLTEIVWELGFCRSSGRSCKKVNAAKLCRVNHSDVVAQIDSLVSYAVPLNDRLFFASERGLFKRPFSNLVKDVCKVGIKIPPGVTPGVLEVPPDPGDPAAGAGGDP